MFRDAGMLSALFRRAVLTDEPLPTVAVSRSGASCRGLDVLYRPADLLAAW